MVPEQAEAADSVGAAAVRAAWLVTRTAQLLAAHDEPPALWCVTRGVREALAAQCLSDAPLWGLGRVVGGEHPEMWGGIVDLADETDPDTLAALVAVVRARPGEDLLSVRGAAVEAARLVAIEREPVRAALECRPDGTYLITGGLGVLGLEIATWLAGRGARRLVLAGASALPPRYGLGRDDRHRRPAAGSRRSARWKASASASASCRLDIADAASRRRGARPRGPSTCRRSAASCTPPASWTTGWP